MKRTFSPVSEYFYLSDIRVPPQNMSGPETARLA